MIEQICIRIFCKMTYFNDMIEKGIKPVIIGNLTVKISCLLHMKHRGQCGPSLTHDHEWQSEPHAKYKIIHGTFLIGNNCNNLYLLTPGVNFLLFTCLK
jgi:hypothetical protein